MVVVDLGMPAVRPFRALRPVPSRVALEQLVCFADAADDAVEAAARADPRHLSRFSQPTSPSAQPGRSFLLLDMVRAGVVQRDAQPSLTVVRTTRGGEEHTHLYGAIDVEEGFAAAATSSNTPAGDVVVVPVVVRFVDKKKRIVKAIEAETDREPDASFSLGGAQIEAWIVDDDSAAARIASLLEAATLSLDDKSGARWGALVAAGAAQTVACFGLAPDGDDVAPISGLAMLALKGPLASA